MYCVSERRGEKFNYTTTREKEKEGILVVVEWKEETGNNNPPTENG